MTFPTHYRCIQKIGRNNCWLFLEGNVYKADRVYRLGDGRIEARLENENPHGRNNGAFTTASENDWLDRFEPCAPGTENDEYEDE